MRWFLVAIIGLVVACGGRQPPTTGAVASETPAVTAEIDAGMVSEQAQPPKGCVWSEVFEILDRLSFDPGSAKIHDPAKPIVDAIADTIKANPRIDRLGVVGGRTAGEPDTLAGDRASAVVNALVARGVPAQKLEAHGHLGALALDTDRHAVWFVMLRVDGGDRRPLAGDARWIPWQRDCAASWKAHREHGERLDCDCPSPPPP
jgi:hypothetical protein